MNDREVFARQVAIQASSGQISREQGRLAMEIYNNKTLKQKLIVATKALDKIKGHSEWCQWHRNCDPCDCHADTVKQALDQINE